MTSIVILGMHRSGTSAITRALNLLGAELGPTEDVGQYWERAAMRLQCDALLAKFGGAWDCPGLMPDSWETDESVAEVEPGAASAIAEYGSPEVLLWKDPRASLTLPFWRKYLGDDPIAIIIYRHPEEVWASLDTRNGFGPGLSFALWERYNSDALRYASGLRTVVFAYSDLIQKQSEIMTELAATLGRWGVSLKDPATTDMELRADQQHHHATKHFSHLSATTSQRELFDILEASRGVHASFSPPRAMDPSPLSLEIIAMRKQFRESRRELWRAQSNYRSLSGSRRKLLSLLIRPYRSAKEPLTPSKDDAVSPVRREASSA
ncbi:MAG: hypothetical protein WCG37_00490 [Actinomycetes bacterium]